MPREAIFLIAFLLTSQSCSRPSECVVGETSCQCDARGQCDPGLVCEPAAGVCLAPRSIALSAIDPAARSCEVLLEDASATVVAARFAASVRGEHVREAPRTAVTFHAMGDAAIGREAVRIDVLGEGDFRVARGQCFDRLGEPISGGGIATDG
jgi:hypothetical protein